MKIAYFVHDLTDAAVARRVLTLRASGADVRLAGFRRGPEPVDEVAGVEAVDLERTREGQFLRRAAKAALVAAQPERWRAFVQDADVVLARNIEMLAIAEPLRRRHAPSASLVYECLDIHQLMAGSTAAGAVLRAFERRLLARSDAVVVSSPAFVREYFRPRQHAHAPFILAENKRLSLGGPEPRPPATRSPGPPWRIGWFGLVRCRRSLEALKALVAANPGLAEVTIRGRPAERVFPDLASELEGIPGFSFGGAYRQDELASLYGSCHFTWTMDWFQPGLNSRWLLPNRLYEGGFYNCPALAERGTEAGAWLEARGAGVLMAAPETELEPFFRGLDAAGYAAIQQRAAAVPTDDLVWSDQEISAFARSLARPRSA